jgi:hypothetical protein
MDPNQSHGATTAGTSHQPGTSKLGRHARPMGATSRVIPDLPLDRRTAERIAAKERSLTECLARLQGADTEPNALNTLVATARDCLNLARELAKEARLELLSLHYEWEASRRNQSPGQHAETAVLVVPDVAGQNLCPDPSTASTPTDFMDTLRRYHTWAGRPSYRVMYEKCGHRYAASTIHSALHSNKLPKLDMVQAIITACGGTDEHRHAFATAWRLLKMPRQGAVYPSRHHGLYPISGTA